MGFLEYALRLSFQKDEMATKIRVVSGIHQPNLTWNGNGSNIELPAPSVTQEGTISFLGYTFPANDEGRIKSCRLFRACVYHLTAHSLAPICFERKSTPKGDVHTEAFAHSQVSDCYVRAYIRTKSPESIPDLAYANSLDFSRMKTVERIVNPATRIMAALLTNMNSGITKGALQPKEENAVKMLTEKLKTLEKAISSTLTGQQIELTELFENVASDITETLESHGPVLEAPSFHYAEHIGPCSLFDSSQESSEPETETALIKSIQALGGALQQGKGMDAYWRREEDAEALQAFASWLHQKRREEKILARIQDCAESTHFKSVSFPDEDYTEYLRTRTFISGGSRRLLDSLRVAQDALDEDPRKEMGQLDLAAVIQVIASKKPATDVFMLDEYLSRSFAWTILFDASTSMNVKGENARALAICIAEATKELLMEPGSWTFFAFSDRFYVLKDSTEPYSRKVRARIGGLKFDGLTYMPDAIQVAAKILGKRHEEQRILVVISDGWPYGYSDIHKALSENIQSLRKKGVIIIGVGVETERMKDAFKVSSSVYDQKDLVRKFSKIFINASTAALET
jgi:hypothetical protein